MIDTILCIDIGTTSLKAALLSDRYTVEAFSRQKFNSKDTKSIAEEWIFALKNAVSELKQKAPQAGIEAICVSGNGPTIVMDNGLDSTTLLWNENYEIKSKPETKSLYIPRFLICKENFSGIWENSKNVFSGPEYFIYRLTGTKLSILPEERFLPAYWNEEELQNCGFAKSEMEKFPPFVKMGSFAGKLCEKIAIETELLEGTFVFCGAPDFVVALLGTGTIFPGLLCDRAGSSEGLNLAIEKPIFSEGIRTLPSAIPYLWNASALIPNSGKLKDENPEQALRIFSEAISKLRKTANENGVFFPNKLTITGGQTLDDEWLQKKADAANIQISVPWCNDAELIGDLILARVALGDYDDIEEATMCLCKSMKTFIPRN